MLSNKVALISGGAQGIGRSVVERFVAEGVKGCAIVDINLQAAQQLSTALNNEKQNPNLTIPIHCDVSNEEEVIAAVKKVKETFGRIDILVNNAVRFEFGNLLPTPESERNKSDGTDREATSEIFDKVMSVNVKGYANFIKHCARVMNENELSGTIYDNKQPKGNSVIDARDRGSIVNICSVSSWVAQPNFVPYNASKAALLSMSRCCALDFAKLKIRVNAVSPGSIETDGSHNHMKLIGLDLDEGRKTFGDCCALKRQGAPEEVASAVVFLASNNASFMTGSNITVDGGNTFH